VLSGGLERRSANKRKVVERGKGVVRADGLPTRNAGAKLQRLKARQHGGRSCIFLERGKKRLKKRTRKPKGNAQRDGKNHKKTGGGKAYRGD